MYHIDFKNIKSLFIPLMLEKARPKESLKHYERLYQDKRKRERERKKGLA
jgi:hypothetical protein